MFGGLNLSFVAASTKTLSGSLLPAFISCKEHWRVRSVALLCFQLIACTVTDNKIASKARDAVMVRRLRETDARVRQVAEMDVAVVDAVAVCLGYKDPPEDPVVAAAAAAAFAQASFAEAQAAMETMLETELAAFSAMQEEADAEQVDPVKKQEKVLLCRKKNLTIKNLVKNIGSVAKKLDVTVEYLAVVTSQLASMDGKIDSIQSTVSLLA